MAALGAEPTFARRPASARCGLAAPNPPLFLHHFCGKQDSRACGADPCDSFSSDVVGRSVGRRAYRKRKATKQRHATIETHQFHRDLALVMIHCQHGVECAAFCAQEYGIRGKRAFRRDPVSAGLFHRGSNRVDLFPPEISAIAGMGVEAGDRDARLRRHRDGFRH